MNIISCQKCGEQTDFEDSYALMGFQYCTKCYEEECRRLRDEARNDKPKDNDIFSFDL